MLRNPKDIQSKSIQFQHNSEILVWPFHVRVTSTTSTGLLQLANPTDKVARGVQIFFGSEADWNGQQLDPNMLSQTKFA